MTARWAGYRWFDFVELDGGQQAFLLAAYRDAQALEGVIAHYYKPPPRSGFRGR